MLEHMAALVGSHSRRGDAPLPINGLAQVHSLRLGVVMVGQFPGDTCDLHICDSIVRQHFPGHIGSCHPV